MSDRSELAEGFRTIADAMSSSVSDRDIQEKLKTGGLVSEPPADSKGHTRELHIRRTLAYVSAIRSFQVGRPIDQLVAFERAVSLDSSYGESYKLDLRESAHVR